MFVWVSGGQLRSVWVSLGQVGPSGGQRGSSEKGTKRGQVGSSLGLGFGWVKG